MSGLLRGIPLLAAVAIGSSAIVAEPLPPDATYRPLPTQPLDVVKAIDEADKAGVMQRQGDLLEQRYNLSDRPVSGVMMSGGRKPVQDGVRVRLPADTTWDELAAMSPGEIRAHGLLPEGFKPLPHVKQATGGQVFPDETIREVRRQEGRDLRRFDVDMDLPEHLRPEFPPPIFLTSHPELGDISRGQLLTIRNFYELTVGLISPVQLEGLRLLLTPFPQEEFNQTEDRKSFEQHLGVACLDCHASDPAGGAGDSGATHLPIAPRDAGVIGLHVERIPPEQAADENQSVRSTGGGS